MTSGSPEPAPLKLPSKGWLRWLNLAISAAILGVVCLELRRFDIHAVLALVPTVPAFWLAFLAYYLVAPFGDWVILRRLWRIPPAGFFALVRKLVCNEILLGYSGEVYFYAWARRHASVQGTPFGAIKDVSILSAVAGNGVTLLMILCVSPMLPQLALNGPAFDWSVIVVAVTSFAVVVFQRRLLTLPAGELRFVLAVHVLRIVATTALGVLVWHLALPSVAIAFWALLAAFRLLLSRLPFMPNKEVAFAGLALMLVGRSGVAAVVAMVASLLLGANLLFGGVLAACEFAAPDMPGG